MSNHDFTTYLYLPIDTLLVRLAEITSSLSNLYEEIAMIEAQNIRDKALVLQSAQEPSSSGRRDRVSMTVVEGPATYVELCGTRDALTEEKWFIVRMLEVHSASHA